MPKVTLSKRNSSDRDTVVVKTRTGSDKALRAHKWWKAKNNNQLAQETLETLGFLKENQQYRYRQCGIWARLYGNMPLMSFIGSGINKMTTAQSLPIDRPTMNVVQSCVDTLVSRIIQTRPRPFFLTDNGDSKARKLAKEMNDFCLGEFFQTKAYEKGELILRDAAVLGAGCLKVYENPDHKVELERVLLTELLVDPNEALMGDPRQMFQLKLVDRSVLMEYFPKYRSEIELAEQAYPDATGDSSKTIADQVMVVEAWHLPSSKKAGDGRHTIACTSGVVLDEEWTKNKFPFVFMHYSPRLTGFWGQGLSEQLMGTQVEINKLLMTISSAINLVGIPRVFVEDGSKVVKAHLNNQVGSIVTYRGTKPEYEVAPCMPQEVYAQLQRLVEYAYQQCGISTLAATSQKPAGLNSGEAIRSYDDIQSDRLATLERRYNALYVDLAYQIVDVAKEICEREGSYETVYPNKNGTQEIDLPAAKKLEDPFVFECYDISSLPKDPSGRLEKIVEMMQAGLVTPQEGRRLLDYPDIEQEDKLATAGEERILKILDDIVEEGKYTPPDSFLDLQMAAQKVVQYINLYGQLKIEGSRMDDLRNWFIQVQMLMEEAQEAATPPQTLPQANPQATPQSPLVPNGANPPS